MKKLSAAAFTLFIVSTVIAQPNLQRAKAAPSLKPVIEKVARDYYQNFNNIKGDTVSQTESTIEFKSKIIPEGAIDASITKYINPYSYSWQTTMFQSEDYQAAVGKYRDYYKQLDGCTLTFYDKSSYKLGGNYDTPDENRAFASSILQLDNSNPDLRLFKVEVALTYSIPNWTVRVMVYEKVADDEIRPTIQ